MLEAKELLNIKEASIWATNYIGKDVTPSNITYLINYGRILKTEKNGTTLIPKQELVDYYENYQREAVYKKKLGNDLNWALSFDQLQRKRISIKIMEQINTDKLIYWIDKDFVQNAAQERIGRNLNDDEILQLTKMIENGLWEAVNISVKTAIDEVSQ